MATATAARAPEPVPARAAGRRPRVRSFYVMWTATLTVVLGLLFTGVTALTVAVWLADPLGAETSPVVDLGFFALGGILIVGLAGQLRAPERHVAGLQQSILALLALAGAGFVGGRIEPLFGALVLLGALAPLVVVHPSRRELLSTGEAVSRPLAVASVAALGPALLYASSMLELARGAGPSCFLGQCVVGDRFAEMAALAVAVPLVAALASLRTAGWILPARVAGASALLVGAVSLALPDEVGALGPLWAAVAAAWGASVVLVAHVEAGRGMARPPGVGVDAQRRWKDVP